MPEDNLPQTRKFPIALLIAAAVFLYILSSYGKGVIILRLAELLFTMSLFLILMAVFYEIKKINFKLPAKINILLKKLHKAHIEEEIAESPVEESQTDNKAPIAPDGLIEIKKETVSVQSWTKTNIFLLICEIAYIVLFCGIAFWRIFEMIARFTLSIDGYSGIVTAVLLSVFPCVALIYLKMRKTEGDVRPCDKISYDMLTLSSYVSFVFAAVIAASLVLKINILIVLPWVYCIVLVYLVGALAFNILLSIIKKDILGDFNYTLFPKFSKTKEKKEDLFDTKEVKQNFSLKSLYTIKYAVKILPGVILGLGFVLFLSTTVFVVQPHQQALVYRLGTLATSPVVGEGIHLKFPWPIDKADIYDVRRVNSMQIGYASPYSAHYLWTRAHDGGENMLLTGNGNEMVAVNLRIIYTINDLYSYVKNCTNPEEILSAAAYEALMNRTVDTTLDEFLSVDRNSLSAEVADELSGFCAANSLGLSVLQVIVESIHPPVDIADIYQRVVTALVIKNTLITRAITTAERRIIDAQQYRITVVNNAVARKFIRISEAQKEMAVYYAAMEAYAINPGAMQIVKYVDTYEKIIAGNKVYVFSPSMEAAIGKSVIGKANVIGVNNE